MSRSTRIDTVFIITCIMLLIENAEQDIYLFRIVNDELPSYVQQRSYGTQIHSGNFVDLLPTLPALEFYLNTVSTQKPQRNPEKPVSRTPVAVQNQQRRAEYPPDQFYDFASADRNQVFPVSPVAYERTNVNLHERPTAAAAHRSEPPLTEATRTTTTVFTNEYQQKQRTTTESPVQHNPDEYVLVYPETSTTRHAPAISDDGRTDLTNASHTLPNKLNKTNDTRITGNNTMVNVTLDERGSFEGACPSGNVRVKGICQKPD